MVCCTIEDMKVSARRVVFTSFFINILDVTFNLLAAIITGSVVMLSEALHGAADLTTTAFLIVGLKKSQQPVDARHPFGHGKEMFFWTLIAGLLMFVLMAGLTLYFGWQRFFNPQPLENIWVAYILLIFGVISNSYTFSLSFRRLLGERSPRRVWRIFIQTSLIETKATFILDLMGTTSAALGLLALVVFGLTGDLRLDGLGAIIIGLALGFLAFSLLLSVKDLLIGRSASAEVEREIKEATLEIPGVEDVLDLRTMLVGPEKLLVNIEVHLTDKFTTDEIERLIDRIKENVREEVPTVQHIQVELETPDEELAKK